MRLERFFSEMRHSVPLTEDTVDGDDEQEVQAADKTQHSTPPIGRSASGLNIHHAC